jgi:dihydroorotase
MAELFDMKLWMIAFGDYKKVKTMLICLKSLQYVQDFDGLVIAFPQDEKIKGNGVLMKECFNSIRAQRRNLAEELQIARNLFY